MGYVYCKSQFDFSAKTDTERERKRKKKIDIEENVAEKKVCLSNENFASLSILSVKKVILVSGYLQLKTFFQLLTFKIPF
jgi:hypothetical protein